MKQIKIEKKFTSFEDRYEYVELKLIFWKRQDEIKSTGNGPVQ